VLIESVLNVRKKLNIKLNFIRDATLLASLIFAFHITAQTSVYPTKNFGFDNFSSNPNLYLPGKELKLTDQALGDSIYIVPENFKLKVFTWNKVSCKAIINTESNGKCARVVKASYWLRKKQISDFFNKTNIKIGNNESYKVELKGFFRKRVVLSFAWK
jgi:hypothetical protein